MALQIYDFDIELEKLQKIFGNPAIHSINGAGCVDSPKFMLLFMNPTARNISADRRWVGLRAPWIGTKSVWKMLYRLNLIDKYQFERTQKLQSNEWTNGFAEDLYTTLFHNRVYITNLAKCTQDDARKLSNKVFKEYFELTLEEIVKINPQKIISFGVQVSSILLNKKVEMQSSTKELLVVGDKRFEVYPTYYPVGQGMRNMDKAVNKIIELL